MFGRGGLVSMGLGGIAKSGWGAAKSGAKTLWGNNTGRGALIGAGIGAYQGSDNGFGGMIGGAIAGAGAGAAMGRWGGTAMNRMQIGSSKAALKGVNAISNNKFLTNQGFGGKLGGAMASGLNRGSSVLSNKYAGKALFGLGAASAGLIGTSMLDSNRGY
jgi:hypothetical protein